MSDTSAAPDGDARTAAAAAADVEQPATRDAATVTPAGAPAAAGAPEPVVLTATVRRSPKYSVFFLLGAAVGVLAALILTSAFHGTDQPTADGIQYSFGQVFGFLLLFCVPIGLALAGTAALIADRVVSRWTREYAVTHERIVVDD